MPRRSTRDRGRASRFPSASRTRATSRPCSSRRRPRSPSGSGSWTTIVILPAHDAVAVAKQMASVDVLSRRPPDGRARRRWSRARLPGRRRRRSSAGGSAWTTRSSSCGASGPASRRSTAPTRSGRRRCSPAARRSPPVRWGRRRSRGRRGGRWGSTARSRSTATDAQYDAAFDMIRDAWTDAGRTDAPHCSTSIWYGARPRRRGERLRGYAYDYMKIFGEDVGQVGGRQRRRATRRKRCASALDNAARRPAPTSSSSCRRPSIRTSSTAPATRSGSER